MGFRMKDHLGHLVGDVITFYDSDTSPPIICFISADIRMALG